MGHLKDYSLNALIEVAEGAAPIHQKVFQQTVMTLLAQYSGDTKAKIREKWMRNAQRKRTKK